MENNRGFEREIQFDRISLPEGKHGRLRDCILVCKDLGREELGATSFKSGRGELDTVILFDNLGAYPITAHAKRGGPSHRRTGKRFVASARIRCSFRPDEFNDLRPAPPRQALIRRLVEA